eukprot:TRINITY_DN4082_c0_g1_i1.p1 TRINITY_DN4082_c0_g1~~TRINITY_DN4082_c0_g1_i1.p1  ORF type:complete len:637 (+),score=163.93 TRINITY_DN4082_c0_g1_i1:120-2030(+)
MGAISLLTISKELILACRELGHVLSEAFASLVASTIFNPNTNGFYVERTVDENDARTVVEEAAKRILAQEACVHTMRLQASYEASFSDADREAQMKRVEAKKSEDKVVHWISNFAARFDQDFDTLTGLYKKIYQFLLLRCTHPHGSTTPSKDPAVEKEVAAALESVFPRVGLRSFVALTGAEKAAQLQELAGIVLGIRLFNQHQRKGGIGLPTVEGACEKLKAEELFESVQKEAEEVNDLCKNFQDAIVISMRAAQKPQLLGGWNKIPDEQEIDKCRGDLLYHRQYLCYLLNLQDDLAGSIEKLTRDQKALNEELTDLDALIGGRVSVPKEQVYPRFDAVAKGYRTAFLEVRALEARATLYQQLKDMRKKHFPQLSATGDEMLRALESRREVLATLEDEEEENTDLNSIPGPSAEPQQGPVRLTVENAADFLQVPLDFQGFCIHTLATQSRLLVPGNPALGVIRYAGRHLVFATERGCAEFCAEPDRFFGTVRDICYRHPELIHLMRLSEDFPRSSLHMILQMTQMSGARMQADVQTDTPLHFVESNIDKKYEWNEWKLRREALHMADIREKTTSATQTALSHLRRESETQVYLPREVATNTAKEMGTNPPRWKKYYTGLRGEPQPMRVAEVKFDL